MQVRSNLSSWFAVTHYRNVLIIAKGLGTTWTKYQSLNQNGSLLCLSQSRRECDYIAAYLAFKPTLKIVFETGLQNTFRKTPKCHSLGWGFQQDTDRQQDRSLWAAFSRTVLAPRSPFVVCWRNGDSWCNCIISTSVTTGTHGFRIEKAENPGGGGGAERQRERESEMRQKQSQRDRERWRDRKSSLNNKINFGWYPIIGSPTIPWEGVISSQGAQSPPIYHAGDENCRSLGKTTLYSFIHWSTRSFIDLFILCLLLAHRKTEVAVNNIEEGYASILSWGHLINIEWDSALAKKTKDSKA